jgi:shikimate dehydrogenase
LGGYNYGLFEVEPEELDDFFSCEKFHGINVTIPYKQDVMRFCAEISSVAKEIGSVNTILRKPDGTLFGDNTDAAGFEKMVYQLGVPVEGKKIIIFGNGGSSLSVYYVMKKLNAGEITTVSIEDNNADFLANHTNAEILVNCTPVGMYPNTDESPVSLELFPNLQGVLDLVYNPTRTRLLAEAERREVPNIGGLLMLVGQAAVSSEIFTSRDIKEKKERQVLNKLRRNMENIILIGMPGCGKSTHGRIIAESLKKTFVDTDTEIEKESGCTIPEIFEREGEAGFREKETAVIAKFGKESGLVIATGGGCVTRNENYFHLHQNGIIIFTPRDTDLLAREGRPLSQGDLEKMHDTRLPMYLSFADASVRVESNPKWVSERILEVIDEIYSD